MTKIKAFTLTEVLITLTVVGLIAALTVPSFVHESNKRSYVAGFLKANKLLKDATARITADNGGTMIQAAASNIAARDRYCEVLNCVKTCTDAVTDGCCSTVTTLDGGTPDDSFNTAGVILADGMNIVFDLSDINDDCNLDEIKINNVSVGCGKITIDINGLKAPNAIGRDVFYFQLHRTGISPEGVDGTLNRSVYCNASGSGGKNGETCGARIIAEGNKMNY